MKRILITGANSYIGKSVENWLIKHDDKYYVDTLDLKKESWRKFDFSKYDVVFHVAGIAHVSSKKNMEQCYLKVNCDLAIETAIKAKNEDVKLFIFMSSIIIYGKCENSNGMIDKSTIPNPNNIYGKSKLLAEKGIQVLETDSFKVAIVRPPMIYGKNSKGNYPKLSRIARWMPAFPNYENVRSIIYIDNFCEYIKNIIDNNCSGLHFPQNSNYIRTSDLVATIASCHGRNIILVPFFNGIIRFLVRKSDLFYKPFGNLAYEMSLSKAEFNYQLVNNYESIAFSEIG